MIFPDIRRKTGTFPTRYYSSRVSLAPPLSSVSWQTISSSVHGYSVVNEQIISCFSQLVLFVPSLIYIFRAFWQVFLKVSGDCLRSIYNCFPFLYLPVFCCPIPVFNWGIISALSAGLDIPPHLYAFFRALFKGICSIFVSVFSPLLSCPLTYIHFLEVFLTLFGGFLLNFSSLIYIFEAFWTPIFKSLLS